MIHLEDEQVKVKEPHKKILHQRKDVYFVNAVSDNTLPEGYMSSEEFWKEADKRIIKVCKQYGVL